MPKTATLKENIMTPNLAEYVLRVQRRQRDIFRYTQTWENCPHLSWKSDLQLYLSYIRDEDKV